MRVVEDEVAFSAGEASAACSVLRKKKKSGLRKLKNAVKFDDFVLKFKKHAGKGKLKNTVILTA